MDGQDCRPCELAAALGLLAGLLEGAGLDAGALLSTDPSDEAAARAAMLGAMEALEAAGAGTDVAEACYCLAFPGECRPDPPNPS